ncbi:MAG: hypothetical protein ACI932_002001 [Paracoccaceae bacterium]|jgi:hypothetical protein
MILPMMFTVWQVLAETHGLAKKGFGELRWATYVEYAAGSKVTDLLTVYTKNTLPLLLGLVAPRPGPFFVMRLECAAFSPIPIHNSRPIGVRDPIRTV